MVGLVKLKKDCFHHAGNFILFYCFIQVKIDIGYCFHALEFYFMEEIVLEACFLHLKICILKNILKIISYEIFLLFFGLFFY